MPDSRPRHVVLFVAVAALACAEPAPPELPECATYRVAEVRTEAAVKDALAVLERAEQQHSTTFKAWEDSVPPGTRVFGAIRTVAWRRLDAAGNVLDAAEVRLRSAEKAASDALGIRIDQGCSAPKTSGKAS